MVLLTRLLAVLSHLVLKRYRPKVVGITGSVGKTSTKVAVATVLRIHHRVRESVKSYNNEIGLPLTILGRESAGRSLLGWLRVCGSALWLAVHRDRTYPEVLVLEMGADRPDDITYLTTVAPCDVGVLTSIAPTHLERFKNIEAVAQEKSIILTHLRPGATAVRNADDAMVSAIKVPNGVRLVTYGFGDAATVRASDVAMYGQWPECGLTFKVTYEGSSIPVHLPQVVGVPAVYAALGAMSVGLALGENLVSLAESLGHYQAPPGRLRLLAGIKNTIIVDDSYNASPRAAMAALDTFAAIPVGSNARRFAVLGDMLELGDYEERAHEEVGEKVAQTKIDVLVTVGERARAIARTARLGGLMADAIVSFSEAPEAARYLEDHLRFGDLVLVKGSQLMRMERIVKAIMAEPERASELLVRQDRAWQKR